MRHTRLKNKTHTRLKCEKHETEEAQETQVIDARLKRVTARLKWETHTTEAQDTHNGYVRNMGQKRHNA